ncbi:hypothetical protein [Nostoc sp. LEGE 12450]|nr:hypothetical protein [Nostoc sp. LEGE 12450]
MLFRRKYISDRNLNSNDFLKQFHQIVVLTVAGGAIALIFHRF